MIYLVMILSIVVLFLLTRLYALKKELGKIIRQLQSYTDRKTNKKVNIALIDKDIEKLGVEINKLIDLFVTEQRKRVRYESHQKQEVSNISHDLRTPLTSVIGYIQLAESKGTVDGEQQEYLSIAKKRAKRLEELLNDFFELSVIESGEYQLHPEKINIKNLTIDVLMGFFDRFNEKKIEPIIDIPETDIYIMGDPSAVSRVIENLLSNAIKYSSGEIAIVLEEKDTMIRLIVKNDVENLAQSEVDRFFERFYMADQTRSGNSTGLGLSIVKSFMLKMDGNIRAELKNGQLSVICEWKL